MELDVAVIGAGAIGLMTGAVLARAGHRVTMCARRPVDRVQLERDGASSFAAVASATAPSELGAQDIAVLAVKAHHTAGVAAWLAAVDSPGLVLVAAQNGVDHEARLEPFVRAATIVPAIVHAPVDRVGVDHVIVHTPSSVDVTLPLGPASNLVAGELRAGGLSVRLEREFVVATWRKLMANVVSNPLTALTGRTAEVLRRADVSALARDLVEEAAAVGRAAGVRLAPDEVDRTLAWLHGLPDGAPTSMLQDRLARRPLEFEALTGALVRTAERLGVAVPVNRTVLQLLAATSGEG